MVYPQGSINCWYLVHDMTDENEINTGRDDAGERDDGGKAIRMLHKTMSRQHTNSI